MPVKVGESGVAAQQTAYGSAWGCPARTGAVLRAAATRHGVELREVSDEDLAAAVVAAHLWACAHSVSRIDTAGGLTQGAMGTLSAVLLLAAGHGATEREEADWDTNPGTDLLLAAEQGARWLSRTVSSRSWEQVERVLRGDRGGPGRKAYSAWCSTRWAS